MQNFIKKLRISNYKSISDLTIENIGSFAVFAGPNGAGKTNFFDALKFVSDYIRFGIIEALKLHGGWENIYCVRMRGKYTREFIFEIEIEKPIELNFSHEGKNTKNNYSSIKYQLSIKDLHDIPKINETVRYDNNVVLKRIPDPNFNLNDKSNSFSEIRLGSLVEDLMFLNLQNHLYQINYYQTCIDNELFTHNYYRNFQLFRIDPIGAKVSTPMEKDSSVLDEKAHNLSSVLMRLEKNDEIRETILDYMSLFVPQLENIQTKKEKFQNSNVLTFKEQGAKKEFPAHLISDGTIYALSLLTAILDRKENIDNWTLIEEPERGLHPQAITEIIKLMREKSNVIHPIWLTTHNATLVRTCLPEELFFVEKENGNTIIKKPLIEPTSNLPLDEAWLSNSLNGGIPW